jgi:hypothetical protein
MMCTSVVARTLVAHRVGAVVHALRHRVNAVPPVAACLSPCRKHLSSLSLLPSFSRRSLYSSSQQRYCSSAGCSFDSRAAIHSAEHSASRSPPPPGEVSVASAGAASAHTEAELPRREGVKRFPFGDDGEEDDEELNDPQVKRSYRRLLVGGALLSAAIAVVLVPGRLFFIALFRRLLVLCCARSVSA